MTSLGVGTVTFVKAVVVEAEGVLQVEAVVLDATGTRLSFLLITLAKRTSLIL